MPLLTLKFKAQAGELQRVRDAVRSVCERRNCPADLTRDLVIAVGEACQNIVRHAYDDAEDGEATLEILGEEGILEFRLYDTAPPVDPDAVRPVWPDRLQPGGLGICLMHEIMDLVEYPEPPHGRGNYLRMVKSLDRS